MASSSSNSCEPVVYKRPAAPQAHSAKRALATKRAVTRPAAKQAPVQYAPDDDAKPESTIALAEWAQPVQVSQPSWAAHAVSVLQRCRHLPARTRQEKTIELNIWSDCSGINSEMFALRELGVQLRALVGVDVKWILHCACDMDPTSRRFSELNHDPVHVSDRMVHRNLEAGQIYCEKHGTNHDLPRAGVD